MQDSCQIVCAWGKSNCTGENLNRQTRISEHLYDMVLLGGKFKVTFTFRQDVCRNIFLLSPLNYKMSSDPKYENK